MTRSVLVVVVLLMPAITASAAAQTVAISYEQLRRILTRGQKVVVIDPAGETVRGRVTDVSPSRECYRNGTDCTDYGGAGGVFVIGAGIFGGIGACVGTPVDLATPHKELVVTYRWQPSRARTLKVGPRIDRTSLGVAATLGF